MESMELKKLSRSQFLKGGYNLDEGWISVKYSDHAKARAMERVCSTDVIFPQAVNVMRKNIYCAMANGKDIEEFGLSIPYSRNKWMVLIIVRNNSVVKTVYFLEKNKTNKIV